MTTRDDVLEALCAGKITREEANEQLDQLEKKAQGPLTCKVAAKGGLSVYGLQRNPVTLYVEQWERVFAFVPDMKAYIKAHTKEFRRKDDKKADEAKKAA